MQAVQCSPSPQVQCTKPVPIIFEQKPRLVPGRLYFLSKLWPNKGVIQAVRVNRTACTVVRTGIPGILEKQKQKKTRFEIEYLVYLVYIMHARYFYFFALSVSGSLGKMRRNSKHGRKARRRRGRRSPSSARCPAVL